MTTVRMNANAIGGTINLSNTGSVTVPTDGIVTVDVRDAPFLLAAGAAYINTVSRYFGVPVAPAAATAGRLVASTALANGTLSIAHQPDVPRQGVLRIDPGTSAITAGSVTTSYTANDGTATVDTVSAVMPGTTVVSSITSKGILVLSSVVVAGIVGGASPLVQLNDTNSLSVPVDPGFTDFAPVLGLLDGAAHGQSAVASSAASFTPSTAPNGTHTFGMYYNCTVPIV